MSNLYKKLLPFTIRHTIRSVYYLIRYFPQHFSYFTKYILKKSNKNFEYNLAIVTQIKNEGQYLKEWIEYHRIVGVDKFILYDNGSDDNTKEVLQPYIASGIVDYTILSASNDKQQYKSHNNGIKNWKNKVKYIGIIDADEYIVPVQHDTILHVLDEIESEIKIKKKPFVGLVIKWVMFGFNGHYNKPDGLITENFTKSDGIHRLYKTIVNPRMVLYYRTHSGDYLLNRLAVDEYGKDITETVEASDATINKIRINHYWTKSYEELLLKYSKGCPNHEKRSSRIPNYNPAFLSRDDDFIIKKFIPLLKQQIHKNK